MSYLVHRRIHTGVMPYKCTACDKSFRYKVSQRSHKCPANPSGTVINHDSPEQSSPKAQDTIANQSTTSTEIFSSPEYSIKLLTGNMELGNVNVCASNEFVSNNFNVNVLCPAMEINTQNLQIVQQDQNTPVASEVQTTQSTSDQGFDRGNLFYTKYKWLIGNKREKIYIFFYVSNFFCLFYLGISLACAKCFILYTLTLKIQHFCTNKTRL